MRRLPGLVVVVVAVLLGSATPAAAQDDGPLTLVHREDVTAGPYQLVVAFTEWPMLEDRSLDIVFRPADGVDQVRGTLTRIAPSGQERATPLLRHPRMRDAYGLDIVAFDEQGRWTLRFALDGPRGPGDATLTIDVGPRPGPPVEAAWIPTLAVVAVIVGFAGLWWVRYRPRSGAGRSWADV